MKALLSGGPAPGPVDVKIPDRRPWTIEITHVNCGCEWCNPYAENVVRHLYERDDTDLFRYQRSVPRPLIS